MPSNVVGEQGWIRIEDGQFKAFYTDKEMTDQLTAGIWRHMIEDKLVIDNDE